MFNRSSSNGLRGGLDFSLTARACYLASRQRKLKNRTYLWKRRPAMLAAWHRTPIRFRYPKKLSSLKQDMTFRPFNLVREICSRRWSN